MHELLYRKLWNKAEETSDIRINTTNIISEFRMVPEKRKTAIPERLSYDHLMQYEKTKKWKDEKYRSEYEKDRKREQRLKKKLEENIKK